MMRLLRTAAIFVAIVTCANIMVFVVERTWATPVRVPSHSMEPNLRPGDRVLLRRTQLSDTQLRSSLRRGDIVVFVAPTDSNTLLIKRVIALPGEIIEMHDGVLAIDDERLVNENWLDHVAPDNVASAEVSPTKLSRSEIFVMGDNRADSVDSRVFGPVDLDSIEGVATRLVWPPSRWGPITGAHDRG